MPALTAAHLPLRLRCTDRQARRASWHSPPPAAAACCQPLLPPPAWPIRLPLQNLVEYISRKKIYDSQYWKQECFGLSAERLVDKAVELKEVGWGDKGFG